MDDLTLDAGLGVGRDDGARRRRPPRESGGICKREGSLNIFYSIKVKLNLYRGQYVLRLSRFDW